MNFITKHKDSISSLAAIAGTSISLIALAIATYSLKEKPKMPNLVLKSERISANETRIVTYNGGDGPCAEFKISYPDKFKKVEQIVQYQESVISNAKLENGNIVLPPYAYFEVGKCEFGNCEVNGGFLSPNQVFALRITHDLGKYEINARCIDRSVKIKL